MSRQLPSRILRFFQTNAVPVLAVVAALTLAMGYLASGVPVRADLGSLVPETERNTQLIRLYGGQTATAEYLVLAAEAENPYEPEKLRAFYDVIRAIESQPSVHPSLNPFNQLHFERRGTQLAVASTAPGLEPPASPEEARAFRDRLLGDPFARGTVVSEDGRILVAYFPSDPLPGYVGFMRTVEAAVEPLRKDFTVRVTGLMAQEEAASRYVMRDVPVFLGLAGLFILVMYYLGFGSLRAVLFPLLVVLMATVWTVGFMRLTGFSLSLASIVAPPLILTLGSSYSIHVLNQYFRDGGSDPAGSVGRIAKTIAMASTTTLLGFAGLLVTSLRAEREFSVTAGAGIAFAALISLVVFPAGLSLIKPPEDRKRLRVSEGFLSSSMRTLSALAVRYRWLALSALGALAVGAVFAVPRMRQQTDYMSYFPPRAEIVADTRYLIERLGGFQQLQVTLTAPEGGPAYFLDPAVLVMADEFERALLSHGDAVSVVSFATYVRELNRLMTGEDRIPDRRPLVLMLSRYFTAMVTSERESRAALLANQDFSRITLVVRVRDHTNSGILQGEHLKAFTEHVEREAGKLREAGMKVELWGSSLRFLALASLIQRDQWVSSGLAILLVLGFTAIVFRSFSYGLLSLVPLVAGILLNVVAMAVTGIPLDMTTAMVLSVTIGTGVDNAIHFLIQYVRQKALGYASIEELLGRTLAVAGRPIVLTTASILAGLAVLLFASFKPIAYFGLLVALALVATTAATLFLLPAVIAVVERRRERRAARESRPVGA